MLIVTSGEGGIKQEFEEGSELPNAKLMNFAKIALAFVIPPKVPSNCGSKSQVQKWGGKLRAIADLTQTFTFADWRHAVLAAHNMQHSVTVGKKRLVVVTKEMAPAFYDTEENVLKSKMAILKRVAQAPKVLDGMTSSATESFKRAIAGKTLIYQAAYMSGDMFAVGAALKLKDDSYLLLIYDDATAAGAKRLLDFYVKQCGAARLLAVQVTDSREQYKHFSNDDWGGEPDDSGEKVLYQIRKTGRVRFKGPGGATSIVADKMEGKWGGATLRDVWVPTDLYYQTKIDQFLAVKGITRNGRYVILWTRFSGKGVTKEGLQGIGAHPELDISYSLIRRVIAQRHRFNRKVIIVGPDRGQKLGAMGSEHVQVWGEYYKDLKWTKTMDRAMEYAVFTRMQDEWRCDVVHLGMRSGAMDVAALLGMKTYFIEDVGNQQIKRTKKWTGEDNTNEFYKRIAVEALPTLTGQILSLEPTMSWEEVQKVKTLLKGDVPKPPVSKRVRETAQQLEGAQKGLSDQDIEKIVTALT